MTKTIAQLWNGNLEPSRYSGVHNAEMQRLEELIERSHGKLEKILNDEQKKLFEIYCGNINEYIMFAFEQSFCDGYCLGTKITVEALTGAESVIER